MSKLSPQEVMASPDYQELIRSRRSLGTMLTIIMLLIYYGFVLLIAFSPSTLGRLMRDDSVMTVGIPIGVGVILASFLLTGIYVFRANSKFDELTRRVKEATQ